MIYKNGAWMKGSHVDESSLRGGITLYEVIRIFDGSPLFLRDNIERLRNSIERSTMGIDPSTIDLRGAVESFLKRTRMKNGNLKYLLHIRSPRDFDEYLERIAHKYPSPASYRDGVSLSTLNAVRENPEIKYLNMELRSAADALMAERRVYEVLLVDGDGCVTEGSKSNIFFIRGGVLYTAPDSDVLPGTSRKRLIELAERMGIELRKERIPLSDIGRFEAAFITGTSPLILPIKRIDEVKLNVTEPLMRRLMSEYFKMLKE